MSAPGFMSRARETDRPASLGVPTPFPRISTFIVLPRPPGITSVFSARRSFRSSVAKSIGAERHQEIHLIEKAERRAPFRFCRTPHAREVDVRGQILLARLAQPAASSPTPARPSDAARKLVSVPAECVTEYSSRGVVTVVDQDR